MCFSYNRLVTHLSKAKNTWLEIGDRILQFNGENDNFTKNKLKTNNIELTQLSNYIELQLLLSAARLSRQCRATK